MKHTTTAGIDIYPVGVLADLLSLGRAVRARHPQAIRHALGGLRYRARYITERARDRNWRAVKNTFNGYHAEPNPWPEYSSLTRCGSGWTKRRALASLHRHGYRPEHLDGQP